MTIDPHTPSFAERRGSADAHPTEALVPISSNEQLQRHIKSGNTNTEDATTFWKDRFRRHAGQQPVIHCFPQEYSWPRSETAIVVPDNLLKQARKLCDRFRIRLDDLLYGTWAIVAAQHGPSSAAKAAAIFTIPSHKEARTPHSEQYISAEDIKDLVPLVISFSKDISVLSHLRHVAEVVHQSAAASFLSHEEILRLAGASRPQVKLSVDCEGPSPVQNHVMSADDKFPLVINISTSPLFKMSMRHSADLPKLDARLILEHFTATLQNVTENPKQRLSEVRMILPVEEFLLSEYGKAAVPAQTTNPSHITH